MDSAGQCRWQVHSRAQKWREAGESTQTRLELRPAGASTLRLFHLRRLLGARIAAGL